ncbi:germ cell nuclear acidic protein-like [Diorhabda sublineata]|uniref:germ cell nuclear acidic protein-like n=1 Tax=Diorhabda sublineata TaxID=1163346 RepID=UPI0024E06A03|nr:germ cell nuclear acidic protein-like [Diorhabda sublineata]
MDDSFNLLSTMSPKIKVKLKAGENKFRKVRGASILALKKNIRRNSIYDKYIATESNQDINIVENYSTKSYESSSNNGFQSVKVVHEEDKNKSIIEISDSSTDSSSVDIEDANTKPTASLTKDKFNAISNWVAKVNQENETSCSEYTELSTIYNSVNENNFLASNKGTAVNSTFHQGCDKKFNELFVKNNKPKIDETDSTDVDDIIENSLKDLIIEDSFEIQNRSLKSRLEAVKDVVNRNAGTTLNDEPERDLVSIDNQDENEKETDNVGITGALGVLDELYGNSWRVNKDLILSKTEPRKKTKLISIKNITSDRKSKRSLLYKNPYLDREKSKTQLISKTTQKSRLEQNVRSPWLEKLKNLCDPDTDSENSPRKITHTKLKFDDESSEDETTKTTSKYFQNKTRSNENKENEKNDENVTKRKPEKKKQHRIKSDISIESNSGKSADSKRNRSSTSNSDICHSTKPDNTKITKKITSSTKKIIDVSSSDNEWDAEVSKIERKLDVKDGYFSFLASLSENVPISKCDMSARIFRNNFKKFKNELSKKLFKLYNDKVFDNILPEDMPIEWNDRMRSSAGFCYCKKVTRRNGKIERSARIVLSSKVLDRADRLRDTLIHEMCHAVTWISNCISDGHGDHWKSWAFKAMETFPELPIIKRCHNYVISTKYTYRCTSCGYSIGRHSKSLDIERKRCGYCLGKFEVLINKTNKKGEIKAVAATPKKEPTGFALFVKENYSSYKTPERKHADVMKMLGQKFQTMKVK